MKLRLTFESENDGFEIEVNDLDHASALVLDYLKCAWEGEQFIARVYDGETVYEEDQTDVGYSTDQDPRVGPWVKK